VSDRYEAWLAAMDDQLERLRARMPSLDGTPASVAALEAWLLERFPTYDHTRSPDAVDDLDLAARYVGEVLRVRGGMRWKFQDNPDLAYFDLPVVSDGSSTLCPLTLVTASTDRRTGDYLTRIVARRAS
jgi:hypothetical protein